MRDRGKAKAVERSGKVSLCALDEQWPATYLQVYCDAVLETDPAEKLTHWSSGTIPWGPDDPS